LKREKSQRGETIGKRVGEGLVGGTVVRVLAKNRCDQGRREKKRLGKEKEIGGKKERMES